MYNISFKYSTYLVKFHTVELYIACLSYTAVVTRESLRREVLAVVLPADEAGITVGVAVTVPVTPGTGTVASTAGPVTAHTETLHCLLTAVGGGGDAGEHLVTVVSPAGQLSSTVAVSVTVSAPQTTRLAGGAAGALASLPVTVLHIPRHTSHVTRHVILPSSYMQSTCHWYTWSQTNICLRTSPGSSRCRPRLVHCRPSS